ncbi:MAG: hypothetical protein DRH26_00605 [Deltaproteobacteria bacterium]|nr:MAG: hypothetical protein DRH26_00605 [Deltaproteobacteria bacterium]
MNKQLQDFARKYLKKEIIKLPLESHYLFKRMYSPSDLDMPIGKVIDNMPDSKLDWAMLQVQRTIDRLASKSRGE